MRLAALVALAALVVAAAAAAKEGAVAHLVTGPPLDAAAGTKVRVVWTVDVPDDKGGRVPFGAGSMFVRLLSATGGRATTALVGGQGRFEATVDVPPGGIGGIRAGLRGQGCDSSGCRDVDDIFPIANNPFRSAGGALCDVAALRATLSAFVRAYDAGDLGRLDALFSRDAFVWYSSGGPGLRHGAAAADRETLLAYFRRRHARGDRLRALTFRFHGYEPARDLGHFELSLERRADDFRGGAWRSVSGKGALDCSSPPVTIAVLSLGPAR
jgi:hypothetical protein